MRALTAIPLFVAFGVSVAIAEDVSHCVGVKDPDDRLNCFDSAFIQTETIEREETNWDVRVDTSSFDDTKKVIMVIDSESGIRRRFGQVEKGRFFIRCEENTTSAFFTFGGHFMSDINGGGRVDYRIDDLDAQNITTGVSTDNQALGLWNGSRSIPFIKRIMAGDTLLIRAIPFNESRVEMHFNISGINEEIAPLREACNW